VDIAAERLNSRGGLADFGLRKKSQLVCGDETEVVSRCD